MRAFLETSAGVMTQLLSITACSLSLILAGCGLSNPNEGQEPAPIPEVGGVWEIALIPFATTCVNPGEGFASSSPLMAGTVTQDGATLSGSFDLNGTTVTLSGSILEGFVTITLSAGTDFIETLQGSPDGKTIFGIFAGQQPDGQGCNESGSFAISIDGPPTPDTTGAWTLRVSGTASDCADPNDDGAFDITVTPVDVTQTGNDVTSLPFVLAGNSNILAGTIVGRVFLGAVSDTLNVPPDWTGTLTGTVHVAQARITGDLGGTLGFTAGGVCTVSGTFTADY